MLQINGWNGQAQVKLGRKANLPPINALETAIFGRAIQRNRQPGLNGVL
jgi:hypothetical protein